MVYGRSNIVYLEFEVTFYLEDKNSELTQRTTNASQHSPTEKIHKLFASEENKTLRIAVSQQLRINELYVLWAWADQHEKVPKRAERITEIVSTHLLP